jgi:hypothetical protein
MAVEDIIPEYQRHPVLSDEFPTDNKSIRKPARGLLDGIGEIQSELGAVA